MTLGPRGAFLLLALAAAVPVHARPAAPGGPAGGAQDSTLAAARAALAAGRLDAAAKLADEAFGRAPGSRDAAALRIDVAIAARDVPGALAAYDRHAAAARRDDAALLAPIARAELRTQADAASDRRTRYDALERLARHGDGAAWTALKDAAGGQRTWTLESLPGEVALARLGDPRAQVRLGEMVASDRLPDKTVAIRALAESGATNQAYTLLPLLADPNPVIQAAAADALGSLGVKEAASRLRPLLQQGMPLVRTSAAVALARLGDRSADALLATMIASPVADIRLTAAAVRRDTHTPGWEEAVRPLLGDPNGLTRLQAAELLGKDSPEARAVLGKAAADANPAVRIEAARIIEGLGWVDLNLLRRLLADGDRTVRLHAAGAILAAPTAAR